MHFHTRGKYLQVKLKRLGLSEVDSMNSVSVLGGGELRWKNWLVQVDGGHIQFSSAEPESPKSYELGAYIGYLYPLPEFLLVASDARLFCFDVTASLVWQSEVLAVDGVVIHDITEGVIYGEGEMNPPAGWRPFRLALNGGRIIRR